MTTEKFKPGDIVEDPDMESIASFLTEHEAISYCNDQERAEKYDHGNVFICKELDGRYHVYMDGGILG